MAINKTYKEFMQSDEKAIEVHTTGIESKQNFTQTQLLTRKAQLQNAIDEIDTILAEFK